MFGPVFIKQKFRLEHQVTLWRLSGGDIRFSDYHCENGCENETDSHRPRDSQLAESHWCCREIISSPRETPSMQSLKGIGEPSQRNVYSDLMIERCGIVRSCDCLLEPRHAS